MPSFIRLSAFLLDLDSERGELSAKLRGLHSLLDINTPNNSIRAFHASFLDFLRDPTRSGQYCPDTDMQSSFRKFVRLFSTSMVKLVSRTHLARYILSINEVEI